MLPHAPVPLEEGLALKYLGHHNHAETFTTSTRHVFYFLKEASRQGKGGEKKQQVTLTLFSYRMTLQPPQNTDPDTYNMIQDTCICDHYLLVGVCSTIDNGKEGIGNVCSSCDLSEWSSLVLIRLP